MGGPAASSSRNLSNCRRKLFRNSFLFTEPLWTVITETELSIYLHRDSIGFGATQLKVPVRTVWASLCRYHVMYTRGLNISRQ